jgi:hypothetical protein
VSDSYLAEFAEALRARLRESKTRIIWIRRCRQTDQSSVDERLTNLLSDAFDADIVSNFFQVHSKTYRSHYNPPLPSQHKLFHIEFEQTYTHLSAVFYRQVAIYEDDVKGDTSEETSYISTGEFLTQGRVSVGLNKLIYN